MRFIALDTETTGIGPEIHRLTEIAAVEFDADTGLPTGNNYHTFINPQREVPEEAVKVHGKTLADLEHEPLFADVADSLCDFIRGAHVVIHNAPFDIGFINAELKRAKKPLLDKVIAQMTDTLQVSRRHVSAKSHTLDTLCDRYGVDRTKRTLHGALIDCEMLAQVYPPLIAAANATRSRINAILPFNLDEPVPAVLDEVALRYLHLQELIKLLETEQNRHKEVIQKSVQGLEVSHDFFSVTFQDRVSTNWDKVTKEHLADVDLAKYRKSSSAMYIKHN